MHFEPHVAAAQETVSTLRCIECLRSWTIPSERWRLKLTDDATPEAVPYCPECATREFGP